jgi:dolichol-phosphate mannosyltransferase
LNRSLTVLLPVRDAESSLAEMLTQVLEMAADVSERFEVLIIDDASSDATTDMAHELCQRYPQIRMVRHKRPLGEEAAVRSAVAQSRGEVVIVRGGRRPVFERIPAKIPPARPNYLGRVKMFAREGL